MKVILRFLIIVIIFFALPNLGFGQTPGDKVPNSSNIYYGTKSNRTSGGVPTWDYYRHTQNDTDWDTSPYKDFFFERNWEGAPNNFRFLYPQEFNGESGEKYPLIIMLHGLGEGGGRGLLKGGYSNYVPSSPDYNENFYLNNNHQLKNGGRIHLNVIQGTDTHGPDGQSREFPGFVLFPQSVTSSQGGQTPGWANLTIVIDLIEDLVKTFPVDLNRIYVHGLSNGGNATWKIVEMRPDLFAAYLPMAGHPQSIDLSKISHIPLWLFQGADDNTPTALPTQTRAAIEDLRELGATPRYTEYEGTGHNAWDQAYKEPDFFSWMLGQSKTNIHVVGGRTSYCTDGPFTVDIELDPNFGSYQWEKNGVVIPGATQYKYTASEYATYRGSFVRAGSTVREWSDPVEITEQDPTEPVTIVADGSTTLPSLHGAILPSLEGATSVKLSVPEGYADYNWQNLSATTNEITVNTAGQYRVSVTEENGCPSAFSPAVTVTVNGSREAVVPPTNYSVEPVSQSRINIFWSDNSDNETGFEVYRATQPNGPYEFVTKTKNNVVYFADKDLSAATTYYYKLRAVNDIGSSPYTADELSASTSGDTEQPSIPQNLTAATNLDLTSITLSWNASHDDVGVADYTIYKVNANNSLTAVGTTSDTSYIHTGLTAETNHIYVVKATDASGKSSEQSNQASATTIFCGLQYNLYARFIYDSVDDIGEISTELKESGNMGNFDLYPGVDYYNAADEDVTYFGIIYEGYIYLEQGEYTFNTRSDDGSTLSIDGELVVSNNKRQSPTTVQGTFNATTSKAYRITVKYFNSGGGYEFSVKYKAPGMAAFEPIPNEILCSTIGVSTPPLPDVPQNFEAIVDQTNRENQINLSWAYNDPDATGFELYRSNLPTGPFELIYTADANATEYQDTGLESSTVYYYRLRAIGVNGTSAFTDETGVGNIFYSYYEASTSNVQGFNFSNPKSTGYTDNFNIGLAERSSNYVFKFEGEILISEPGTYTFYTNSDDGSLLFINNEIVVNNNGNHAMQERQGGYEFDTPGAYPITVTFNQGGGGAGLEVRYNGPGLKKQIISNAALNSDIVNATTAGDTEPPTAPSDLTVKSVSNTSVSLSWIPSTDKVGVVGYQIFNVPPIGEPVYFAQTDPLGDVVDNIHQVEDDNSTINFINSSFGEMNLSNQNEGMSLLSENEVTAVTRVSTSIGGLTNSTDYSFIVKGIDAAGNLSDASNVASFKTGDEAILPIELIDFFAIAKDDHIELNWITASETNNDYFVVLRSLDGKNFKEIGTVDGAGDSHEMLYYLFNDGLPINGIMYYQLKQVDTNGVFATSRIIKAEFNKDQNVFDLNIYPNPVKNHDFKIELSSSDEESNVYLKITDLVGKVYFKKEFKAQELLNTLLMSKSGLSGGMYIISVQQSGRSVQKKVIVE